MKAVWLLAGTVFLTMLLAAQQKTVEGFTRSPYEHIINVIDEPFAVREVKGIIVLERGNGMVLPGVLFEILGPGNDRKIRRVTTNAQGQFKMRHMSLGTYKFKATLSAYQSVMGTIIVTKEAAKANEIKIEMRIGV